MKHSLLCLAVLTLTTGLAAQWALAGSIWQKGSRVTRMQPSDDVARDVGDVITIVINEKSVIANKINRNDEKKTARSVNVAGGTVDLGTMTAGLGKNVLDLPQASFNSQFSAKMEGKADYGSNRSLKDMITVTVEDVLPNGNMVIIGRRVREVAGDRQVIEVSGIIRPSDISFENTVDSDRVANFNIVHKTSGTDTAYTKPGWLTRVVNVITPF
ncbi:MAG: flagellar basal body L-ring protein FlgH [Phycisphaerae bacterium]|nr:flagellar basal body L-ring protein FlgH [Phycisphaerae bacterium]